ncbi:MULTISPECIES: hypothetical protein [Dissulfurimicrobium]|uniref:hypothetical protein n=1 Tax=Dissulfurimicrobium TaxID=1769732 RepID=UPI001ED9E958|nr:hypothetical protein [Dissulfurimicrobium hydrothermale]UKL13645.1 hypothetical protein LGS26_09310 [Dissulfurimicrobium hydrothermale]
MIISVPEVCRAEALYIDPSDNEDLADKIELPLNDGKLQQILRSKGFGRARAFSWPRSARSTWRSLTRW